MLNIWSRFGGWATNLRNDPFRRARLRLTGIYTGIIAIILLVLSQVILALFRANIHFIAERYTRNFVEEYFFVSEAVNQLQVILLLGGGGILLLTAALSYWVAGKTLEPIRQILEQQRQFLSDASHELRTPLTVLKTNMEVEMASKSTIKEHKDNLKGNLAEVDSMAGLVNNLLLLSRLDSQKNDHKEKFSLNDVVFLVVDRLEKYAGSLAVTITSELPKNENLMIKGNKEEVISAIANVVKNAVEYNQKNGQVWVKLLRSRDEAKIVVKDDGRGIAKEQLPLVFNRFFRGEKGRGGEGTGLGLPITKAVALSHHGKVEIDSREGTGTTVTMTLPLS